MSNTCRNFPFFVAAVFALSACGLNQSKDKDTAGQTYELTIVVPQSSASLALDGEDDSVSYVGYDNKGTEVAAGSVSTESCAAALTDAVGCSLAKFLANPALTYAFSYAGSVGAYINAPGSFPERSEIEVPLTSNGFITTMLANMAEPLKRRDIFQQVVAAFLPSLAVTGLGEGALAAIAAQVAALAAEMPAETKAKLAKEALENNVAVTALLAGGATPAAIAAVVAAQQASVVNKMAADSAAVAALPLFAAIGNPTAALSGGVAAALFNAIPVDKRGAAIASAMAADLIAKAAAASGGAPADAANASKLGEGYIAVMAGALAAQADGKYDEFKSSITAVVASSSLIGNLDTLATNINAAVVQAGVSDGTFAIYQAGSQPGAASLPPLPTPPTGFESGSNNHSSGGAPAMGLAD